MRIFVYEYTCADPSWQTLPESLRQEGLAMLSAVLQDFQALPGVTTTTLLADTFPHALADDRHTHHGDEQPIFTELAQRADWTLVIAPEFNQLLTTRCQWVEAANGRALNATPDAIELTTDKQRLAAHFIGNGISTPEVVACFHLDDPPTLSEDSFPAVMKPRYGAGSQATFLMKSASDLRSCLELARQEEDIGPMLVTRHIPGQAVSVAFLTGPGKPQALMPTKQHLSEDGRFHYRGGSLPLPAGLAERAIHLATRAIDCVPGLLGYVGVDLVLGETDAVIEINPRLTTSYIGLRQAAQSSLALAMLHAAQGDTSPIDWRNELITFQADG